MAVAVTNGVKIEVNSEYIPERSDPKQNYYFFAYHIKIINEGSETVQLISRHWIITDFHGKQEEVKGEGVIGEQPLLEPGESYSYTSFCPLSTSTGTMVGTYQMITNEGESFDAQIPLFNLEMERIVFH